MLFYNHFSLKATPKMMIKEPKLLANIYFSYAKSNQYPSTGGNLTM